MNAPTTTFTSPSGDEMVVMSRVDFDRLCENADLRLDVMAYDRAKAALLRGEEEALPAEMVARLVDGEHPVRVWRQYRGLNLEGLAGLAGLSGGYLSQIETGKRDGTVESFKRLAAALGVSLDDLV